MADFRLRSIACTKCTDQTPLDAAEFLEHSGQFHFNLHLFKCTGCDKKFSTAFYASLHPCTGNKKVYLSANLDSKDVACRLIAMQKGLNDSLRNSFSRAADAYKNGGDPSATAEKEKKNDGPSIEEESPASPVTEALMDDDVENEEDPYVDYNEPGTSSSSATEVRIRVGPKTPEGDPPQSSATEVRIRVGPKTPEGDPPQSSATEVRIRVGPKTPEGDPPQSSATDVRIRVGPKTPEGAPPQTEAQQGPSHSSTVSSGAESTSTGAEGKKNGYSSAEEGEILTDDDEDEAWILENYGNRGDEASKKRNSTAGIEQPPPKKACPEHLIEMIDKKNVRKYMNQVKQGDLPQDAVNEILSRVKAQRMLKALDSKEKEGGEQKQNGTVPEAKNDGALPDAADSDVHMEDLEEVDEVGGEEEEDDGTLYVPKGNNQNDDITVTLDDDFFPGGSSKNGQNSLNNRTQRRGTPLANRVTFPDKRGGGAAGGTF